MNSVPLDDLTKSKFTELLNTRFQVSADSAEVVELELAAVTSNPAVAAGGEVVQFESFSLMFHGPGERLLPQKMYSFIHERLGKFQIFIVPVGREGNLFRYQAVFNRRIKPA